MKAVGLLRDDGSEQVVHLVTCIVLAWLLKFNTLCVKNVNII